MADNCKRYLLIAKDGREIVITVHCHSREQSWYEVVVPMPVGPEKRVCSEYWWKNPAHALAAGMARFTHINNGSLFEEGWDDRTIPGATRRKGTA